MSSNYKPDMSKAINGLVSILAIRYMEPSYIDTVKCIEASGLHVVYVDREPKGIGSLAEAINRGMRQMTSKYVMIVTNVTFDPLLPAILISHIGDADIIHPSFGSDHKHLRVQPNWLGDPGIAGIGFVPFVEFTAPLVNREKWLPVDESMPYWGFDLDHGWRVWENGGKVLCDYTVTIGHTYIRNIGKNDRHTLLRLQRRRRADGQTKLILKRKYGAAWAGVLWHKSEKDIGRFISDVVAQKFPAVMTVKANERIEEFREIPKEAWDSLKPLRVIDNIQVTHTSLNEDGSYSMGYLVTPRSSPVTYKAGEGPTPLIVGGAI